MPLFMDLHRAGDYQVKPTIEEIKRNHIADLKTQAKYGVRFIQYWINEEAGLVFCMMEAPDKDSCMATHQEAHGDMPCNIIELKGGDYEVFMGDGKVNSFDITENMEGGFDTGYRSILVAEIISLPDNGSPYKIFREIVKRFNGREATYQDGRQSVVFNKSSLAIACARALQQEFILLKKHKDAEIRIGISSGVPVTDHDSIFASAVQLADRLCDFTIDGGISISAQAAASSKAMLTEPGDDSSLFKVISPSDEKLLMNFMTAVSPMIESENISMEKLSKSIGISKAQLYRKIKTLSGHSPNGLIQEIKLKNAFQLIGRRFGNVAEIAFASGFNSPSYFSKSFQKRFGRLPAKILRSVSSGEHLA
jgi:AraC-like DNA-binding protein